MGEPVSRKADAEPCAPGIGADSEQTGAVPRLEMGDEEPLKGLTLAGTVKSPKLFRLWRSRLVRFWPLFVAVAAVVTGVISVLPIVFADESSTESLSVNVTPFRAQYVSHFALSVDAPIESFPPGERFCSNEQEEWLKKYGVQFQRDYLVELRNTAGSGGSLAVSNFHSQAESSEPGGVAYLVECDKVGDGGIAEEPARLIAGSGEGAFFDKSFVGAEGIGHPNSPLAYNLRPGETGQFVLSLASLSSFDGVVVANLASGDDAVEVQVIPGPSQDGAVRIPGVISPRTILMTVENGQLTCNVFANSSAQVKTCEAEVLFQTPTSLQ